MIFNLGLTANAAAAHENDLAGALSQPQPSNSPWTSTSPFPSTAITPLPGLTALYKYYRGMEPPASQRRTMRDMTQSPVESVYSGDGEGSNAEPGFQAASHLGRSQSVRKSVSRPKTVYQLAHPAAHPCHRRLRIRPKLLLQLQRVSQTPRPLPILDVLPSSVFLPRLARKFPTIFRGKNGLGPNDLIIVISDFYDKTKVLADLRDIGATAALEDGNNNSNYDDEHQVVVGTICQLLTEEALSQGKAEICLNYGPVWEATPLPNGSYEFVAHTEQGIQMVRWVPRGARNRRTSAPPGSVAQAEESKRFTFSVINPNTRRHPVIASMTRNHLEVNEEYVVPTTAPSSFPTSTMSALSEQYEAETGSSEQRSVVKLDETLRHLIVITSIWVAFREGWSQNFRYNDSALALHTKTMGSPMPSRHTSPTATRDGPDYFSDDRSHAPENGSSTARKHRVSMSNVPSSSDRVKALSSGKLAKRSNSTGAAFIERSKRRSASGSKGRAQRHSANENLVLPNGGFIPETIQQEPSGQHDGAIRFTGPEPSTTPNTSFQRKNSTRQPAATETAPRVLNEKTERLAPVKPKRRHRIGEFFECIFRKHGNH